MHRHHPNVWWQTSTVMTLSVMFGFPPSKNACLSVMLMPVSGDHWPTCCDTRHTASVAHDTRHQWHTASVMFVSQNMTKQMTVTTSCINYKLTRPDKITIVGLSTLCSSSHLSLRMSSLKLLLLPSRNLMGPVTPSYSTFAQQNAFKWILILEFNNKQMNINTGV